MEAHQPRIFQDLRLALSVLYSLPPPSPASRQSVRPSSEQAHEFLLQFQCRNVRRKISSAAKSKNQVENNHDAQPPLDAADFGSSWLACLALLSSLVSSNQNHPQASYAEALFAAQT